MREIVPRENNMEFVWRPAKDDKEFSRRLRDKLIEEAHEFHKAETRDEQIEEAADIMEVLLAMLKLEDIKMGEVEEARQKIFAKKGGFDDRVVWIDTMNYYGKNKEKKR